MSELREIYKRCDVSNNGTDNPMSEDEFLAYISKNYIKKSDVLEAIGEDEPTGVSKDLWNLADATENKGRNKLRTEIKQTLKLEKGTK